VFRPEDLFKIVSVEDFDVMDGHIAVVTYENRPTARILKELGPNWLDSSEKIDLGELFAESVRWSRGGELLVEADKGGAERRSVFAYDQGSLTPILADGNDNVDYAPSPDGRMAAFVSNREGDTMRLYIHEGQEIRRVSMGDLPVEGYVWSPDSRFIVYSQGIYDNDLWVHDLHTGRTNRLMGFAQSEQHVCEDGWGEKGLLVASNHTDYYRIGVVGYEQVAAAAEGGEAISEPTRVQWLTDGRWDAVHASWFGGGVAYVENVDGDHRLVVGGKAVLEEGVVGGLKSTPEALYFTRTTHSRDYDLYTYTHTEGVAMLTDSMGEVAAEFSKPKHVEYVRGGVKIHALLYEGRGDRGAIYIHGGPDYQSMDGFNPIIQLLVQRGFSVLAPNYRGSTGYGRMFNHLNDGDLGGGDLLDVVEAKKLLGSRHVAVLGASYGGYLTMMCVTQFPDEWCSAVATVPFVNWFTEKQHEREVLRQYDELKMGSDEKLLRERSPIYSVHRIKAPLLVLAGENDPRCPAEETVQLVKRLKELDVKVEYKIYSGEGHGFSKKENWVDSVKRTVEFLDQNCV